MLAAMQWGKTCCIYLTSTEKNDIMKVGCWLFLLLKVVLFAKGAKGLKKEWSVPKMETLDVRLTGSGKHTWPWEGTIVFDPSTGEAEHVGPETS